MELDAPDSQLVVREGRAAATPLAVLPGPPPVLPYMACTAPPDGCCPAVFVPVGARAAPELPAAAPEPAAAECCCSAGVSRRGPPLLWPMPPAERRPWCCGLWEGYLGMHATAQRGAV